MVGTLTNFGGVTNEAGAALTVDGGAIGNYGAITNPGIFTNSGTVDEYCGSTVTGNAIQGTAAATISTVACPPMISPPGTVGTTTGTTTPAISGTAMDGATVNLFMVSSEGILQPFGTTTAGPTGIWSATTLPLSLGIYTLVATASNSGGTSGLSDFVTLTISSNQATTTSVSCDSPVAIGATTTCTATVSEGSSPSGTVSFTQGGQGTVSFPSGAECTLSAGTCSVTVTGVNGGSVTLTASYPGDTGNAASSGATDLVVLTAPSISTTLSSTTITVGLSVSDAATLTGGSNAAGASPTTITPEARARAPGHRWAPRSR